MDFPGFSPVNSHPFLGSAIPVWSTPQVTWKPLCSGDSSKHPPPLRRFSVTTTVGLWHTVTYCDDIYIYTYYIHIIYILYTYYIYIWIYYVAAKNPSEEKVRSAQSLIVSLRNNQLMGTILVGSWPGHRVSQLGGNQHGRAQVAHQRKVLGQAPATLIFWTNYIQSYPLMAL